MIAGWFENCLEGEVHNRQAKDTGEELGQGGCFARFSYIVEEQKINEQESNNESQA